MNTTTTASTGMAARKMRESFPLKLRAITSPPIQENGARMSPLRSIITIICTWLTSLVSRVTREEVFSRSISRKEKVCTLSKIPWRSRVPKETPAMAENTQHPAPPIKPAKAIPSILIPLEST